jgi:hypothetical protein
MPLTDEFLARCGQIQDRGMGTENASHLLYAMVRMRRPRAVLAVGLGYSTLFILKALADNVADQRYDTAVLSGAIDDPIRQELLLPYTDDLDDSVPLLYGIDDGSEGFDRIEAWHRCVEDTGLSRHVRFYNQRYQDFCLDALESPVEFLWLDCGHQLDYPNLMNKFWPVLREDNGLCAVHYTYVDIDLHYDGTRRNVIIGGAPLNAMRRQLFGLDSRARFELLSIVEPYKRRQGSVTLLRKFGDEDACREAQLGDEMVALYGASGVDLNDLNC